MKNAVIGYCSHYEFEVVEPFLASWQKFCSSADLILFTAHLRPTFLERAASMGIHIMDASPYLTIGYHALCARFFMYRDYLAQNGHLYGSVMLTDVRDVIFQSDPFLITRECSVIFAAEDQLIRDEPVWNGKWLRELYGDELLQEIAHNPVSCAGTTLGNSEGIFKYIELMCEQMTTRTFDRAINYDQGIHNYIAWKIRPNWGKVDLDDRIFSTVIKTRPDDIHISDDRILIHGKAPAVVHQWDRQASLRKFIETSHDFKVGQSIGVDKEPPATELPLRGPVASSDSIDVTPPLEQSSDRQPAPIHFRKLEDAFKAFRKDTETLSKLYDIFTRAVVETPWLLQFREYVERENLGYGDRAFYWFWKLLVDTMPSTFRFLEIGVYKGQILTLIGMLAQREGKCAQLFGVTPITNINDKYSKYDSSDYADAIERIQSWASIPSGRRALLIEGLSTDDNAKARARICAPYQIVYVDGGHEFPTVCSDIIVYGEMLTVGGYLVLNDASCHLPLPDHIWRGHEDVARAVRELIESNRTFSERLAIGHLRVWQKVEPR
jgi:hypothetical protein